jgi:hypothetical protein
MFYVTIKHKHTSPQVFVPPGRSLDSPGYDSRYQAEEAAAKLNSQYNQGTNPLVFSVTDKLEGKPTPFINLDIIRPKKYLVFFTENHLDWQLHDGDYANYAFAHNAAQSYMRQGLTSFPVILIT